MTKEAFLYAKYINICQKRCIFRNPAKIINDNGIILALNIDDFYILKIPKNNG